MDEEAHAGDDEQHDGRELIHLHGDGGLEGARGDPREELADVRLAVEDAEEDRARHEEGEAQRGHRRPVRTVACRPAEEGIDERAHERKERDQPDES